MLRKYPSLFVLVFTLAGIVLADNIRLPVWISLLGCLLFFLSGALMLKAGDRTKPALALAIAFLFFSAFHYTARMHGIGPRHLSKIVVDDARYHIFGRVAGWPLVRESGTEIAISLDSLGADRMVPVQGRILLKLSDTTTALQSGDRLEFFGRIYPVRGGRNIGGFDYRRYLHLKGLFGIVYLPTLLDVRVSVADRSRLLASVDDLRAQIRSSLKRNLSPRSAALASGFLIGETRDIPADVYTWFRDSGTLHLLAVSGSNVAMILLFFWVVLRPLRLPRRRRALVLMACVFLFALLSYNEPSVMRASVMASLVLLAGILERRYDLNNIIALTALIILLYDPTHLFNVGFQLSFVTAWGLIFFLPRLSALFSRFHSRRWYRWLVFPLLVSIVAQACSVPLVALYFHRVAVISVLANLIIVPLVSLAVVGILVVLTADLILPLLGLFTGSLLNVLLELILWLLRHLGGTAAPVITTGNIPVGAVMIIYLLFVLVYLSVRRKTLRRVVAISALVAVNLMLLAGVGRTWLEERQPEIIACRVPGGIAGVLRISNASTADLVVTDLIGREYLLDEKIIDPLLQQLGIERLTSIFVLSCQYDAIDDLLRTADRYNATSLYVRRSSRHSFADVMAMSPCSVGVDLVPFGRLTEEPVRPGYYLSGDELVAVFDSSTVIFASGWTDRSLTLPRNPEHILAVVGGKPPVGSVSNDLFGGVRFSHVICSGIEQRSSSRKVSGDLWWQTVAETRPYDLNLEGAVRIHPNSAAGPDIDPCR